nr:hypothetical protein [Mycoplasmopsis bovis]
MPFVNLDDSKGEAIIAVKITAKLENGYTESIIGTLKLTGFKKSSSSASSHNITIKAQTCFFIFDKKKENKQK